jgi:predicted nucleic acid-binding protein
MRVVFADTSYWIGIINPRDHLRQQARAVRLQLGTEYRIVTSEMVFTETLNSLSVSGSHIRHAAAAVVGGMMANANVEIVAQTPDLFRSAFDLYRERPDKDWSLTDCASFLIMDERRITEALTHDRHFEQNGYRALLRD